MREISLTGKPTDCRTITMVTKPALGILAAPILAIVAVKLIIMYCMGDSGMSFTCAMNIGAIASYNAVPSMLIVLPIGKTNLVILESMPTFSSKHLNVTGSVAELKKRLQITIR